MNQTDPVRDFAAMSGAGMTSSVVLTSAFNDLVENTIATGGEVMAPAIGQQAVFVDNVDQMYELNNSAASTAAGVDGPIEVNWGFGNSDQWQGLAASLRPLTVQAGN